jgi:hypothetical protein
VGDRRKGADRVVARMTEVEEMALNRPMPRYRQFQDGPPALGPSVVGRTAIKRLLSPYLILLLSDPSHNT